MENNVVEIQLSKSKIMFSLLGAIMFVVVGCWFVFNPPEDDGSFTRNPVLVMIVGILAISFFGIIAVISVKKLLSNTVGLKITSEGIFDNSSGVSAGFIPWNEVVDIRISQVMMQKFITIIVEDPQKYLDRVTNPMKRRTMQANYKTYGSPLSITTNALQTNFDILYRLLTDRLTAARNSQDS